MLSILFGLLSALAWGAADFTGGLASRRTNVYGVVIVAEAVGMVLVAASAFVTGEPIPPLQAWLWGGASGLCGGVGLLILYRSLSSGRMSVAAPVSAVIAVILPLLVGAVTDGLPGMWTFIGFALALAAVWLIARGEGGKNSAIRLNEVYLPLLAGVTFGLFFVFMHQASRDSTLWPIVAARSVSAVSLLIYALITRQRWIPERHHWQMIALCGLLDVSGNGFYVLAGQIGRLDVAAVLGSLYPGSTVALARLVLKERMLRVQALGIVLALAAIVLIAL